MVSLAVVTDDEMSEERRYSQATELAMLRRDIQEILRVLNGTPERKGLICKVDELMEVSERGRWSLKVALWIGGGVIAATTAVAQFKQAIIGLFGLGNPPGH